MGRTCPFRATWAKACQDLRDAHLAADWVNGREAGRNGYWSETVVPFPFVPWPFVPLVSVDDLALSFSS